MPQQPVQRKPQSSMNALMETWRRAMSSRTHTEEPHTACKSYTLASLADYRPLLCWENDVAAF
eukprot:1138605-Pelagomonas_calceolata.AAC.3